MRGKQRDPGYPVRRGAGRRAAFLAPAALVLAAAAAGAQSVEDLSRLSIEELTQVRVTSVSKRSEPLSTAAASVYVITAEDIRRSGAISIPQALRLAPNLDVAQLNAYNHAIAARGFNSPESSNKLLVLVDGRSVYSPFAATVFWEGVDVPVADIERIEVISGPGGTLWGANAVNGVINIITRSADRSQGTLVETAIGNADRGGTVRYGGRIGETGAMRVYAGGFDRSRTDPVLPGDAAEDGFRGGQVGFRGDFAVGDDAYTVQGDLYRRRTEFLDQSLYGGNLLGRWTRSFADGASLDVRTYYDRKTRDYAVATDVLQTWDVQVQHNRRVGTRHELVVGAGYRRWRSEFTSLVAFGFADPTATLTVANVFAQDTIALAPDLHLTLGLKVEHNSYTGTDALPNVRLGWRVADDHMLWTAASRAVRTPSRIDRELEAPGILVPARDFRNETLTAFEIGYRGQPTGDSTLSVTGFYHVYDDLRSLGTTPGGRLSFMNGLEGRTYGVEAWGSYDVTPGWRLRAGGTWLHKELSAKDGMTDLSDLQAAGQDPNHHAQIRSEMDLASDLSLDVALRRVGRVSPSGVPAYTELDAHLLWQVSPSLTVSLHGLNLLQAQHQEVIAPGTSPPRGIGRSVYARLRAEF
ncbi:TonB-dependent receptor plug domain-containing protein [Azospirillum halopraeferens]|uniref:TonB-dependent receptor plug domain-containing protein n=1 Tax=Azospirillum halopraeferens TaxID=34010 RepID=UPI0006852BD7|nr:TonB-dependent receptor [Azospirillum halopraeferens]